VAPLSELLQKRLVLSASWVRLKSTTFFVSASAGRWRPGKCSGGRATGTTTPPSFVPGRIAIRKRTEFAKEQVIVGTYGSGSVVGELCLLTENTRSVTAEVLEAGERVLLWGTRFENLISRHPQLVLKPLKHTFATTCGRLRKSYERTASIF